jgi:hypothetical protein
MGCLMESFKVFNTIIYKSEFSKSSNFPTDHHVSLFPEHSNLGFGGSRPAGLGGVGKYTDST